MLGAEEPKVMPAMDAFAEGELAEEAMEAEMAPEPAEAPPEEAPMEEAEFPYLEGALVLLSVCILLISIYYAGR